MRLTLHSAMPQRKKLDPDVAERFKEKGPDCKLLDTRVETLSHYLEVFANLPPGQGPLWYRGHQNYEWKLEPSALRYDTHEERTAALRLINEFKRVARQKLQTLPGPDEELMWVQTARHYGLPTRLLDWTQNAAIALYFACLDPTIDGAVFLLNPIDLNRGVDPKYADIFNATSENHRKHVLSYLQLDGRITPRGRLKTIAVSPVWDSERILLQRGAFTLHGNRESDLTTSNVSSLVCVPILKEYKRDMLSELHRIGVDEMSIFPEPEHICNQLIQEACLVSPRSS